MRIMDINVVKSEIEQSYGSRSIHFLKMINGSLSARPQAAVKIETRCFQCFINIQSVFVQNSAFHTSLCDSKPLLLLNWKYSLTQS